MIVCLVRLVFKVQVSLSVSQFVYHRDRCAYFILQSKISMNKALRRIDTELLFKSYYIVNKQLTCCFCSLLSF